MCVCEIVSVLDGRRDREREENEKQLKEESSERTNEHRKTKMNKM